jgi:hypothetical protein
MAIINRARLKQYAQLEYNVLMSGLHGVGKTSVITSVFNELYGTRWRYFSASTLDPWVDVVGVPDISKENGKKTLELIRPAWAENDEVEAIMFDEFNRAPDKVINAVMELIQFKSINGHKLNNLKVIWAAINPEDEDDTYSVNHLDPAQLDRFQVHINIPYKIDEEYFNDKFPNTGPIFCNWWKGLSGDIQKLVSPRRADYAAEAYSKGCRLEDFLPVECNVAELRKLLKSIPFHEQIKKVTSDDEALAFVKDINNSTKLLDLVKANDSCAIDFFFKYGKMMPKELTEPFAEFVHARKEGFEVVSSVEELITRLPDTKGNQGTAALINNVQLSILYKNGGSLQNDLRALNVSQKNLITKLTNRCWDVIGNCQTVTLERIFWGLEGKAANRSTNFQEIVKILGSLGVFPHNQKVYINNKLYARKIVDDMNFL